MYEQLLAALVASGIELAPPLVHLIAAGMDNWTKELHRLSMPPTLAGTVIEIIRGVNNNPLIADMSPLVKREYVRAAVKREVENEGGTTPSDSTVNTLIEVALQSTGMTA